MKYQFVILSTLTLTPSISAKTAGELCKGTAAKAPDGNWYCSEVMAITYRNISQPGAYNRTTGIDPNTGICTHERVRYPPAGSLTPLFGQVENLPKCPDELATWLTHASYLCTCAGR
jgi:hypothetical protein